MIGQSALEYYFLFQALVLVLGPTVCFGSATGSGTPGVPYMRKVLRVKVLWLE